MLGKDSPSLLAPDLRHAKAWADAYELIDLQLSPLGLRAIEALGLDPGDIVVDIGCGAGQTLLQLAERVGEEGQVIGVDVSPLLLETAQRRPRLSAD
jgi:ubiquinone/menaquinone biosynthesis C-methylase UbiE